ncbi:bleomycin hydrolase [Coelomomyces lativittatus]|nr:bleomycin hydrolase [Coelomomyces lativittatus]KAJ1504586.1 bleomycin hydrolase [Coelomomyces lativittatus]KAJ1508664.1 bleomycin hydrolase [Coelomomyces lativittatus]
MLRNWALLSHKSFTSSPGLLQSRWRSPLTWNAWRYHGRYLNTAHYDGILIGCYQGETPSLDQFGKTGFLVNDASHNSIFNQMESSHFNGKLGDHRTFFPIHCDTVPPRVTVVGLGKRPEQKLSLESARKATAVGVRELKKVGASKIGIERFGQVSEHIIAEAASLALYSFDHLKSKDLSKPSGLQGPFTFSILDPVSSLIPSSSKPLPESFASGLIFAEAQNMARTWMESPSNLMTPQLFTESVMERCQPFPSLSIQVYHEPWVVQHRMGGFHSVAKGSQEPLRFLEMKYTPLADRPVHVALVGKGVTFDAGGISLKPSSNMGLMKGDMGGAAVVAAVMHAIAKLALPINVMAFIPLCENMPSGSALKPGDVICAANGITIEIDNTDAEGRLLLADALYYATTFHPKCVIDVATLTGAIDVALGSIYSGAFTNSSELWSKLNQSAESTTEPIWRMPLNDSYLKDLHSDVADLKNCGHRSAGACTAAIFLKQFLGSKEHPSKHLPFAHLDIAGSMHSSKDSGYISKGMTGRPTRLLIDFLVNTSHEDVLSTLEQGWKVSSQ